jgi:hypothetical protein
MSVANPLTVLQCVQAAQLELGLPVSQSVYGTNGQPTDTTGMQLGALANRVLDEMRRMNRWTALQFEFDMVVVPPINTVGDLLPISPVIQNIPTTAGITAGDWCVSGPGIPVAARVLSVDSLTQVTMTMENTNETLVPAAEIQFAKDTYQIPAGFDWMNNRTWWDRTNRWELLGPDSPQMDQWHRSGIVVTGPRRHFRILGSQGLSPTANGPYLNSIRIWPAPAEIVEPLQFALEFLSIAAVNFKNTGVFSQYFINDTDTPLLDDQGLIMGIKWMFWEVKGFGSYTTMQNRWVDYMNRLIARDGAAPTINVVKRMNPIFISPANVQDGFFPGPVGPNLS